jgi:signal transduction histidine kinase
VEVRDATAPASILADREQLGRALKNLVRNALDAMEGVDQRRLSLDVREAAGGRQVEFEIRDTGEGLSPEAARRIFQPYFTTRGERGGTGLGLAIAHRIVAEHGGTIRVEGAEGRGATFTVALPVAGTRPLA